MNRKKAMLAAGLLAGAAALTGCTANNTPPAATSQPSTAQQATVEPAAQTTVSPDESPAAGGEETPGPLTLRVDGEALDVGAVIEEDKLLLPLEETGEALGWDVKRETQEEETLVRRSVQMQKEESKITVSWVVSDNTARQITWQKDGLLIPVDTELTTIGETVYVPAAFFETAMRVRVESGKGTVNVSTPEPQKTPDNDAENDEKAVDTDSRG